MKIFFLIPLFSLAICINQHANAQTALSKSELSRDVDLRAAPDAAAEVIGQLPENFPVQILNCNDAWCKISFAQGNGSPPTVAYIPSNSVHVFTPQEQLAREDARTKESAQIDKANEKRSAEMQQTFAMAKDGDARAEYWVGKHYEDFGPDRDIGVATEWYEKSANQGYRAAMERLVSILAGGDAAKRRYWAQRAADLGSDYATLELAAMEYAGTGGPMNKADAERRYRELAAKEGGSREMALAALAPIDQARARAQKQHDEDKASVEEARKFQATFPKRKEVGDQVCFEGMSGYVERIANDKIQIRVRHDNAFSPPNDELTWRKYNQVGLCEY